MNEIPTFHELFAANRPPDAHRKEAKILASIALDLSDEIWGAQCSFTDEAFGAVDPTEGEYLAAALTEMAEDLHAEAGLWQSLEAYNLELFGSPLPLVWKPGDAPLTPLDPRRFQFFIYTVWPHFRPDTIISPHHADLCELARVAADFLSQRFARMPKNSSVASFLGGSNTYGWEIKRKLIWLGTRSYLFRFEFDDYLLDTNEGRRDVAATDDFICQNCTAWSGLGVIDVLAGALKLKEPDRATLRSWHERHWAPFRVVSIQKTGRRLDTMEVVNAISDQPYHIRVEKIDCPFEVGQIALGSLMPWRGEWYWSGEQQTVRMNDAETADFVKDVLAKHTRIAFRYRPDLVEKAVVALRDMEADFRRDYGTDFMLFPDGRTMAEAENQRHQRNYAAKVKALTGVNAAKFKPTDPAPTMAFPPALLKATGGIGVFLGPVGIDYVLNTDAVFSALAKKGEGLTPREQFALCQWVKQPTISADLVRRLAAEKGPEAIGRLFHIRAFQEKPDLDYLLRRYKGMQFRKRYPEIVFLA